MKKIHQAQLIIELKAICLDSRQKAEHWKTLSESRLNTSPGNGKWSAAQCIEHLNRYFDFYLPEIHKVISNSGKESLVSEYKPGILGDYFANSMKLNENKPGKMKTLKSKNPAMDLDIRNGNLDEFLKSLNTLSNMLDKASGINLGAHKTAISISSLIKLKFGDTLRFVVYHIERHIKQAENAIVAS